VGEKGLFFASDAPQGLPAHLTSEPPTKWDDATSLVHFRLDGRHDLRPLQTGWLKLATRIRQGLVVPSAAVLQSPKGPYVLAVGDDRRTVTKRFIGVGSVLYGYAAVTSGLEDGDRVAAMNTFFLDAERRTKERAP
jgi:multidrug efflux pump subunit AcrA (membrane-fusion protein)